MHLIGIPVDDLEPIQLMQLVKTYEAGLIPDTPTTVTLNPAYADLVHRVILGESLHAQLEQAIGSRASQLMRTELDAPLATLYERRKELLQMFQIRQLMLSGNNSAVDEFIDDITEWCRRYEAGEVTEA
jgi:hypothetical protein